MVRKEKNAACTRLSRTQYSMKDFVTAGTAVKNAVIEFKLPI